MTRIATLCLVVVGVLIGMKRFKTGDGSYSIKGATSAPSSRDVPAPSASSAAPASVISKSPRPNIPAHIIRDGKLMPQLAAEYAQQFLEDDPNWQPPRPLTCCTVCSGTDCSYLATRALEHVIPGFQMRHAFSCEIIDYKQDFIRHVLAHKPAGPRYATCSTKRKPCQVLSRSSFSSFLASSRTWPTSTALARKSALATCISSRRRDVVYATPNGSSSASVAKTSAG